MVSEDDASALREFDETDIPEGAEVSAESGRWLEACRCPDWQIESIRAAFAVDQEFGAESA